MNLKQRVNRLESRPGGDPGSDWISRLTDEELNALLGQHISRNLEAGELVLTEEGGFVVPEGAESRALLLQAAEILNRGLARMEKAETGVTES